AVVTYVAGAIDIATRTLRIELMLHNRDGRLKPGTYVQIALPLAPAGAVTIPANTLLFRAEGPNVAVVDKAGDVRLQKIQIARDLGASLEVAQGVTPADRIVLNPPDSIANGDHVTVVSGAKPAAGK
uniref:efflux RND transporter periplasmic adaptor subunit n=1 Tax=Rhodoblastus sp. TaxID=1962975 RepID=UPI003F9D616F